IYFTEINEVPLGLLFFRRNNTSKKQFLASGQALAIQISEMNWCVRLWMDVPDFDINNSTVDSTTGHLKYEKKFCQAKFCICPGGSQVHGACVARELHYGCIPGK
ncbi:unnamed protein product, partial [Ilex paraguariensis]